MKAQVKYRVRKEALWVSRKRGSPNGYGASVLASLKDADLRRNTVRSHSSALRELRNLDEFNKGRITALSASCESRLAKVTDLQRALDAAHKAHEMTKVRLQKAEDYIDQQHGVQEALNAKLRKAKKDLGEHDLDLRMCTLWILMAMKEFNIASPKAALERVLAMRVTLRGDTDEACKRINMFVRAWGIYVEKDERMQGMAAEPVPPHALLSAQRAQKESS